MSVQPVLIDGQWTFSSGTDTFQATNPATGETLPDTYPVSDADEVIRVIEASAAAAIQLRGCSCDHFADFLEAYVAEIETDSDALVETAHLETGLPAAPRLAKIELPRTTNQLRQAAAAAREGTWAAPTIDTQTNIRSMYGPIGPVTIFGPNNFPFAFNSIAGGDFAAAIAAGNPVIAKGHSSHPGTTRLFAEAARRAIDATGMPAALVQLIYRTSHKVGAALVSHPLIGASGYTGSRAAGLVLKEAADKAGKPIYLELSSVNPVFILPGALEERLEKLAGEFTTSCLMGTGQFCTNPGIVVLQSGELAEDFIAAVRERFESAACGVMLSQGVQASFGKGLSVLTEHGAEVVTGGRPLDEAGFRFQNTLLRVSGEAFVKSADVLQTEAFGNGSLFVVAADDEETIEVAERMEGNLTGCIYSAESGADDTLYDRLAPALRPRVGRLLNDKMPTGVAVSPAMNHGGPYPATGHPAFTAVGIPASIHRFAQLQCYDNVRLHRLPPMLRDTNPNGTAWRYIDNQWTQSDIA